MVLCFRLDTGKHEIISALPVCIVRLSGIALAYVKERFFTVKNSLT
jgi:hypothetical protein